MNVTCLHWQAYRAIQHNGLITIRGSPAKNWGLWSEGRHPSSYFIHWNNLFNEITAQVLHTDGVIREKIQSLNVRCRIVLRLKYLQRPKSHPLVILLSGIPLIFPHF